MKEGPPKIEGKREFVERYGGELREKILAEIENHTEGINVRRVEEFATSSGLEVAPYRLIEDEQIEMVRKLLEDRRFLDDNAKAEYSMPDDIAFVHRDHGMEQINGPEYTEGFLVHELVHASYDKVVYTTKKNNAGKRGVTDREQHTLSASSRINDWLDIHRLRLSGQHILGRSVYSGKYIEEGLAESMRAEYMRSFMSEEVKAKMATEISVSPDKLFNAVIYGDSEKGTRFGFLPELCYLDSTEKIVTSRSSIPAFGLYLLTKNIDGLEKALWASRSDVKQLRGVPKMINNFHPGLYAKLMKVPYDGEEFAKATKMIQDIVDEKEKTNSNHNV